MLDQRIATARIDCVLSSLSSQISNLVAVQYSRTSELRTPWGNEGVHNSEMSVTLLLSGYDVVLYNFHEEYAAMISIEHKIVLYIFYCNFDDT